MKRRPRAPRRANVAAVCAVVSSLAVLNGAACSLLFHETGAQCNTTSDCEARGAAFAGLVCKAGTCGPPEAPGDSGGDSGGDGGGVAEGGIPCTKYADCPVTNQLHPEVACDVDTLMCVQLTTDECPFVLGDYTGMISHLNPIFLGAFGAVSTGAPDTDVSALNYKLAQQDFQIAGGIPAGSGGGLRNPVFVFCNNGGDIDAAMTHLVGDVHIPAVIAALSSAQLAAAFSNVNLSSPTAPKVFFMNPYGADSNLTELNTAGLLWHMLGQPSDLATAYAALFPRVEAYVRSLRGLDAGTPMKVATVFSQSTLPLDLNRAVDPVLVWNGGPAMANSANYLNVELTGSTLDGLSIQMIDVMAAADNIAKFQPDVVLSYGSEEVVNLIETLELKSPSTRPFYVIGPYNTDSSSLITWIGSQDSRRTRFVGVNYATAENNPVLDAYQSHFVQAYGPGPSVQGDNYYDAAYFTIYSLVAGGRLSNLTGVNVAEGMPHLVNVTGMPYDIGPAAIGDVLTALNSLGATGIALVDTIGPPDFSNTTGARITPGDVYCINRNTSTDGGVNLTPYFVYDVLRLDAGLEGIFPCYPGF